MNNLTADQTKPQYHPQVFDPHDMTDAKQISLPDYPAESEGPKSSERWEKETKFLVEKMLTELNLAPGQWVLDYGCGAGRIAKALCEKKLFVIGVELTENMRKYAIEYVNDPQRFICVSPEMFAELVNTGLRVDAACSVWCVHHCPDPDQVYRAIRGGMKFNAKFFNVNNRKTRVIPTMGTEFRWIEDEINIWRIADAYFGLCNTIIFPPDLDPKERFIIRTYMRTIVPEAKD
ncbi:MAG: class I SAM-dependent methyltransferase [Victivallaceae bacterium]|nr:class I SAM-dependent methyltransferase [Victivallaceae bacterium]